jgi:hypothetical protein
MALSCHCVVFRDALATYSSRASLFYLTAGSAQTDHNLSLIEYELVQLPNTGAAPGAEEASTTQN